MSNNIKVVCRFRPPNSIEQREGSDIVVDFSDDGSLVKMTKGVSTSGPEAGGFVFDKVFPMNTKQRDVTSLLRKRNKHASRRMSRSIVNVL